jgi:threonine dehydratase
VVDVAHSRIAGSLAVGEVVVALSLETRGRQHREELVAGLGAAGYAVTFT